MSESGRVRAGLTVCGLAVLAAPVAWTPLALANGEPIAAVLGGWLVAPALPVVGSVVVSRLPGHRVGWLLLCVGVAGCLGMFATQLAYVGLDEGWPRVVPVWALWLSNVLWPLTIPLLPLVLLWFPDGQLPCSRWRWLQRLLVTSAVVGVVLGAFGPGPMAPMSRSEVDLHNPLGIGALAGLSVPLHAVTGAALLAGGLLAGVAALQRWRGGDGEARQQLRWVAVVGAAAFVSMAVVHFAGLHRDWELLPLSLLLVGVPGAMGVAILKHRLYDLDLFLNRTVVYAVASASLIAVYLAAVQISENLLPDAGQVPQVLAAGLVAVLYAPARDRVQSAVNRRLFGHRRNTQAAVEELTSELEASTPQEALPALVTSITGALRLPYAALYRPDDPSEPLAVRGRLLGEPFEAAMRYQGTVVGRLVVGPRSPTERLSPTDRLAVQALARHAAVTVYALGVSEQLHQSRKQLITAVEEERRRLRRDLHDGVGPTLAAVGLGLERATRELRSGVGVEAVSGLVERLRDELQTSVIGIRGIVHDLRPPALDDLGLVGALRARAGTVAGVSRRELMVDVSADDEQPRLPAAVEAAAYRIVEEALTNVVRHAEARQCLVRIRSNGALYIEVEDDGRGSPGNWQPGVGLRSMRERVTELGGHLSIDDRSRSGDGGQAGTLISVSLPFTELA